MAMKASLAIAAILLAGCKTLPPPVEVVTVTVKELVPVPKELSKPCDLVPKRNNTVGEMKRVVNARFESLKLCNADKAKIRALGKP